jgi:hypothetical protein
LVAALVSLRERQKPLVRTRASFGSRSQRNIGGHFVTSYVALGFLVQRAEVVSSTARAPKVIPLQIGGDVRPGNRHVVRYAMLQSPAPLGSVYFTQPVYAGVVRRRASPADGPEGKLAERRRFRSRPKGERAGAVIPQRYTGVAQEDRSGDLALSKAGWMKSAR